MMKNQVTEHDKTLASLIHLSIFSKYFIPFGNFLVPIILWVIHKDKPFIEENGRKAINFQMSVFLYTLVLAFIIFPFFLVYISDFDKLIEALDTNAFLINTTTTTHITWSIVSVIIALVLLIGIFIVEIYAVIMAAVYASQGNVYQYPLCIPFLKSTQNKSTSLNQSKNEHIS